MNSYAKQRQEWAERVLCNRSGFPDFSVANAVRILAATVAIEGHAAIPQNASFTLEETMKLAGVLSHRAELADYRALVDATNRVFSCSPMQSGRDMMLGTRIIDSLAQHLGADPATLGADLAGYDRWVDAGIQRGVVSREQAARIMSANLTPGVMAEAASVLPSRFWQQAALIGAGFDVRSEAKKAVEAGIPLAVSVNSPEQNQEKGQSL